MNRDKQSGEQSMHLYTYNIKIVSVKMKVKFQCRMKIEVDAEPITSEVALSDGCNFIFNQDCTLVQRNKGQDYFTLSINLITNKGAKYIAGLAYLYHQELARAAGTGPTVRIAVVLSKCLDPEAVLEFVVREAVVTGKKPSKPIRQESKNKRNRLPIYSNLSGISGSQVEQRKLEHSPPMSPRGQHEINGLQHATRSQIHLPRALSRHHDLTEVKEDTLYRGMRSRSKRNVSKDRTFMQSRVSLHQNTFGFPYTDRDRMTIDFVEEKSPERGSTYKESYSRLKQKLKKEEQQAQKQHQKRVSIEASEANTKIEVLKYQLKCQQLQQNMVDKDSNIKRLERMIEDLERLIRKQKIDPSVVVLKHNFKLQNASQSNLYQVGLPGSPESTHRVSNGVVYQGQSSISALENKVNLANRQLEQLRSKMSKANKSNMEKESLLIREIQLKNARITQLQKQLVTIGSSHSINSKNQDNLKSTLQIKERLISQLEREQQQQLKKYSESEKANKILQKNINQLRSRVEQLDRSLLAVSSEKNKIFERAQVEKSKTNMAQYSNTQLTKNIQKLQNQIQQLQKIKQKYHENLVDMKRIEGERKLQQKQYDKNSKSLQNSLMSLQLKYKEESDRLSRKNQQLQSRSMQQMFKIKQLETYSSLTMKNEIQNYRKSNQRLQKECEDCRSAQRQAKREQMSLQSKVGQQNSQIEAWKNKFKSLQNIHKLEGEKLNHEINRMKSTLEQQLMNQMTIKEKNQKVGAQLAITMNKLTLLDEKYRKQTKQLNGKLEFQTTKNNRLQQIIKKQEQLNAESKDKQKALINKIQKYGENESQYSDLIKRYEHEVFKLKSVLNIAEEKLSNKQQQAEELSKQLKQISDKYNNSFQKCQQVTYQSKNTTNDLQKQIKQRQKLQFQLESVRLSGQVKDKTIQKQKLNFEQQVKAKNQLKQQLLKLNSNLDNLTKDYDRFRDQVYDVLVREFTGIDGLDALGNFVLKNKQNKLLTLKQSMSRNALLQKDTPDFTSLRNSHKIYTTRGEQQKNMTTSVKTLNYPVSTMSQYPMLHSPSNLALNNNDIITTINHFSRQSKGLLNRMIQQYRALDKQYQYTEQNLQLKQNKFTEATSKHEINIHNLQEEITKLFTQKQLLEKKFIHTTHTLQQEIATLKQELERANEKIEEGIFTSNGLQMEKQTLRQFYDIKIGQMSSSITKLQNSISNIVSKNLKLENQISKLRKQNQEMTQINRKLKDNLESSEKKIRQLGHQLTLNSKLYEDTCGKNKQLISQVSQFEVLLSLQKQKNGKSLQLISQEERKLSDTKEFVNNLIKQKEVIVKQEIEKGHRIIELETLNANLLTELERTKQKLDMRNQEFTAERQNTKKLTGAVKDLQLQLFSQKQAARKYLQELKLKQKQMVLALQNMKDKQSQLSREIQNKDKQIAEANSSRQLLEKLNSQQKNNLKIQIARLEEVVVTKLEEQNRILSNALQVTKNQLENANRNLEQRAYEVNSYKEVQERLSALREKHEATIIQLNDELKQKEQHLQSLTDQLFDMEQKYHGSLMAHKLEKQQMEEQSQYKFESMYDGFETKVQQMERERNSLRQRLILAQEECLKYSSKLKNFEQEEIRIRITSKDKLTKTEEEKNALITSLKMELKNCSELKDKLESENKKKTIDLEKLHTSQITDKGLIQKLESKLKQFETKLEQTQSQCHTQAQNQKKREMMIKQYGETVTNYQWMLERQIKKELQSLTKSIMSSSEIGESKRKITDAVKDVQNRISKIIGEKILINGHLGFSS